MNLMLSEMTSSKSTTLKVIRFPPCNQAVKKTRTYQHSQRTQTRLKVAFSRLKRTNRCFKRRASRTSQSCTTK